MKEKKIIIFLSVIIIIAELVIFFTAFASSGDKKLIHVISKSGDLIYEVKGDRLPSFDKYYFENNFGPLKNYNIKLVEKNIPFPVRGWLFASIAFPVGIGLIFVFYVKIISSLFPSYKKKFGIDDLSFKKSSFLQNIFYIGLIVLLISFLFWAVPIIFNSATERFLYMITKYPYPFGILFAAIFIFFLYSAFLKYKLKKADIENRFLLEIKKIESDKILNIASGKKESRYYIGNEIENINNNGDEN